MFNHTTNGPVSTIKQGATYALACKYAGIGYSTFNEWQQRGYIELARRASGRVRAGAAIWNEEQPFLEFLEAIQKAEGDAAIEWLSRIELAASDGHWQAAAWKLERRYPHDYGRTVSTQEPALTSEQLAQMTDDELEQYIAKLNKLSTR